MIAEPARDPQSTLSPKRHPLARALLDLVYPRRCLSCDVDLYDRDTEHLCAKCWANIERVGEGKCSRCAARMGPYAEEGICPSCRGQTLHFRGATAFGEYSGPLRELVHRFKYGRCSFLSVPLGKLLSRQIEREPFAGDLEALVPVPLHWRRKLERGFNQSELLAHQIGKHLHLAVQPRSLARPRFTASQAQLGASERKRNLVDAFRVRRPKRIQGRTVLLVDDVMTTCSTMAECARVLRDAGAKRVCVAAVAR